MNPTLNAHKTIVNALSNEEDRILFARYIFVETLKRVDLSVYYNDKKLIKAAAALDGLLLVAVEWLYQSCSCLSALNLKQHDKKKLSSCPRNVFEQAFNIIINRFETSTTEEAAKEACIYLNILLNKIYE